MPRRYTPHFDDLMNHLGIWLPRSVRALEGTRKTEADLIPRNQDHRLASITANTGSFRGEDAAKFRSGPVVLPGDTSGRPTTRPHLELSNAIRRTFRCWIAGIHRRITLRSADCRSLRSSQEIRTSNSEVFGSAGASGHAA